MKNSTTARPLENAMVIATTKDQVPRSLCASSNVKNVHIHSHKNVRTYGRTECECAWSSWAAILLLYTRYKSGNRKIQIKSTKCQYNPPRSIGWSYDASYSPRQLKYAITKSTAAPMNTCAECRPVIK